MNQGGEEVLRRFEEYDEYDDGGAQAPPSRRKSTPRTAKAASKRAEPAKPKEPEVDLFEFGDDEPVPVQSFAAPSNGTSSSGILSPPPMTATAGDDDDFDDFQSATPSAPAPARNMAPVVPAPNYSSISTAAPSSATQFAQPTPQQGSQKADFSNLFNTTSRSSSTAATPSATSAFSPPPQTQQPKPSGYQPSGPNYFTSVQVQPGQQQSVGTPGSVTSPTAGQPAAAEKKPGGGDAFASLLSGTGAKVSGTPAQKGATLADMAKQRSQAGLYGANAPSALQQPAARNGPKPSTGSSGMDDLLG